MAKKEVDPLEKLGLLYGFSHTSFSAAVQDVMHHIKPPKVKQLLKALIDQKVILPKTIIVVRLATAWLIQREIKNRNQKDGQTLLPYSDKLYTRAVNYGKRNAKLYSDAKKRKQQKNKKDAEIQDGLM